MVYLDRNSCAVGTEWSESKEVSWNETGTRSSEDLFFFLNLETMMEQLHIITSLQVNIVIFYPLICIVRSG